MGQGGLFVRGGALGGDHHVLPDPLQGLTQLFLTVGVHICGVEVVDTALIGPADQLHRLGGGDPLDGQGAEGGLGDLELRAAQSDGLHGDSSSVPARLGRCFPHCSILSRLCKSAPL